MAEIEKVLQTEGFDIKVLNAKQEKIEGILTYDLTIVGYGMQDCMSCVTMEKFVDWLKYLQIRRGNGNQDLIIDLLLQSC